jgi:2-polyprenyl-3-methyl-5-hydroxy-6-metoxy-1,4-benzoquinol methylase
MWDLDGPSPGAVVLTALLPPGPGARLLEIGCGSGADSIHFARHGYHVTAIDIGEAALKLARANAKASGVATIKWIKGDIRRLELPSGDFDLAYDRGCLHCLPFTDWPVYGNNVHLLLKPKAPLFVFGCGIAESAYFAALTSGSLACLKPWFSIEVFDEVQLCATCGHLKGRFALLRRLV